MNWISKLYLNVKISKLEKQGQYLLAGVEAKENNLYYKAIELFGKGIFKKDYEMQEACKKQLGKILIENN